jgi:hypothetical protein
MLGQTRLNRKAAGESSLDERALDERALDERRSRPRYPFSQELVFRQSGKRHGGLPTPGKALNMSSRGILFETDCSIVLGEVLKMAIEWPIKLENSCPLKLVVTGKVTRCDQGQTAVRILRYEWRTAGQQGLALEGD